VIYHTKSSKHYSDESSCAGSADKVEILTRKRRFRVSFQTLNLVHEFLDNEKGGKASHSASVKCQDSRDEFRFESLRFSYGEQPLRNRLPAADESVMFTCQVQSILSPRSRANEGTSCHERNWQ